MEKTECKTESYEEVLYPKPKLYKRYFSGLIDLALLAILGLLFFSLFQFSFSHLPSYKRTVQERDQLQVASGLYTSDAKLLIVATDEDEESPLEDRKETLRKGLETFYLNPDYFSTKDAYQAYQERKKDAKDSQGNLLFVAGTDGTYLEGNASAKSYYDFYHEEIDRYASPLLFQNPSYREKTNRIFRFFLGNLFFGLTLAFLLLYLLVPLLFRRGRKTLGRYLFHLALLGPDGLNLKTRAFLLRFLFVFLVGYLLDLVTVFVPLLVSLGMMTFSKSGQDLFDYVTNTYVVDDSRREVYLDEEDYFRRQKGLKETSFERNDFRTEASDLRSEDGKE